MKVRELKESVKMSATTQAKISELSKLVGQLATLVSDLSMDTLESRITLKDIDCLDCLEQMRGEIDWLRHSTHKLLNGARFKADDPDSEEDVREYLQVRIKFYELLLELLARETNFTNLGPIDY